MSYNRRYPMNHAAAGKDADPADKDSLEMDFSFIDRLGEESKKMLEEINRMLSKYKREPGSDEGRTTSAENDEQEPDRDLLQRISEEFAELAKGILYGGPDFEDKNKKLCERPLYAAPEVDADWNAPDRSDEDGRTPGDDDDIINYY